MNKKKIKDKKKKNSDLKKIKRKKLRKNKSELNEEHSNEKCKNFHNNHKNCQNSCFTPPLPPSHLNNKSNSLNQQSNKSSDADDSPRPEKVKSRWRRKSELESGTIINGEHSKNATIQPPNVISKENVQPPPPYDQIEDNLYLFERCKSKSKKEVRRMVCDCILTKEERQRGLIGCGDDCLNRMLMIECGSRCSLGDHCANKRFQKKQYAKVEAFKTERKGWGLRALEEIPANTFIMEYVGEVLDPLEFSIRVKKYSKEKRQHHYFMALKSDEIIDATMKGNITRFVNHSCDPNSETQKWTVNGELRIGFFTRKYVQAGEEITFDYQFQRYGKEAQKCYCESQNCRGYIGGTESAEIYTDGTRMTPKQRLKNAEIDEKLKEDDILEDLALEEEIAKLSESGGLRSRQQVLMLARLMVRAEDSGSRQKLISIIKGTVEVAYLRLLLDYHCLQLIWSWMVEADDIYLKSEILDALELLPVPNKTMLIDSKVLSVVERWAQIVEESNQVDIKEQSNQVDAKEQTNQLENFKDEKLVNIENNHIENKSNEVAGNEKENQEKLDNLISEEIEKEELKNKTEETIRSDEEEQNQINDVNKTESTLNKDEENDSNMEINEINELNNSELISKEITDVSQVDSNEESIKEKELMNDLKDVNLDSEQEQTSDKPIQEIKETTETKVIMLKSVSTGSLIPAVIRQKSEVSVTKTESIIEPVIKPKPNIASQANKLLNLWKDLKETFRIPRLERQKRHEDEEEADRRTKEVEERRAKGLPEIYDLKRNDDKDTIASILGKRKMMKKQFDGKDMFKKMNSFGNLNDNSLGTPTKLSREEHRKMFEREVAQKDYEEALKKYHKDLACYHAMYGSYYQNIYPNYMSGYTYNNYYQENAEPDYFNNTNLMSNLYQTNYDANCQLSNVQTEDQTEENIYEESIQFSNNESTLIVLTEADPEYADKESPLEVDHQDFKFYADYLPSKDESIFDQVYPPPGIFYITPEGRTLFVPVPVDRTDESVDLKTFENVNLPHFSKNVNEELPSDWREHRDKIGNVYYYNKDTFESQWIFPKEEPIISPKQSSNPTPIILANVNDEAKFSENSSNESNNEMDNLSPTLNLEEDNKLDEAEIDLVIHETSLTNHCLAKEENESQKSSQPNSPSNTGFEVDPRKRKHLQNSSRYTTTAPADTSSSSIRKQTPCSTRKVLEHFRVKMSQYVVHCLNPYRRNDCKQGRILNNDDFKYLARKLTHFIMGKEIKHCKSIEELSCNDTVKGKTKEYVKKFMARCGPYYKPDKLDSPKEIGSQDSDCT